MWALSSYVGRRSASARTLAAVLWVVPHARGAVHQSALLGKHRYNRPSGGLDLAWRGQGGDCHRRVASPPRAPVCPHLPPMARVPVCPHLPPACLPLCPYLPPSVPTCPYLPASICPHLPPPAVCPHLPVCPICSCVPFCPICPHLSPSACVPICTHLLLHLHGQPLGVACPLPGSR